MGLSWGSSSLAPPRFASLSLPVPAPAALPAGTRAAVIIPTYNEAASIHRVLARVRALPVRVDVIVVDDGSPDGTAALVRAEMAAHPGRIHLIERAGKLGLGTAYVAGFRQALADGYTFVCEMDADLSHNPDDLPRLIAPVAAGEADLSIGSRYVGGVRVMNWPLLRLVVSYGASLYTRAITRMQVYDVTAGFVCYHRRVLDALDLGRIRSNGYSFQVEMKYRAWRRGFRLVEVPIVFTERTEGHSKMSRAIVREAAWKVWELRGRSLLGRL
jgi:dolichol-phosphate mannosyltransferase